jgi:hypothetical protein
MAWGGNACSGKLKLAKEACHRHLLPGKLGQVQCVPDASAGGCPPAPTPCAASGKASVCTAREYGEQKLTGGARLRGLGPTECAAHESLLMAACRQNLNPALLKGITCSLDATAGECPPKAQPCHDPPLAATCTAKRLGGKALDQPLTAKGPSGCEAKAELARQVCALGARPSTLDDLVCVFGK